jgi:YesN/AraC family two-component response regulator
MYQHHSYPSSKDKYIKYGFDGYISKPFKKEDLEKILNDNLINNK